MSTNQNNLTTFLINLPKVELHIHMEGSIPLEAMWTLIKKYNGHKELGNINALKEKFKFKNFDHFLDMWVWKDKFINEYEDFRFIAEEVAKDLACQNIRYAELHFTPYAHTAKGLEIEGIAESVMKGFALYSKKITIKLILDICRNFGPVKGMEQLEKIKDLKNTGIIGIGIGGAEHLFPPGLFREVYDKARKYGFKTTAHAGEAAGADSIMDALEILKVDRIGHGTRAFENEKLIEFLKESQLHLEMCPISNIKTGVIKSIDDHPVKRYFKKGLNISINTDDPKMFNNSLLDEYLLLINRLDFNTDDIKKMLFNAVNSSWCDADKKEKLRLEIDNYYKEKGQYNP